MNLVFTHCNHYSETMKTLTISNSGIQATMTVDYLKSRGIDAFSRGSRDYASIVTGGDMGRYEILVPEAQLEAAEKHLKQLQLQVIDQQNNDGSDITPTFRIPKKVSTALKRSIIFCVAGLVVLPLFNLFSLYYLYIYLKNSKGSFNSLLISALMLLLNIAAGTIFIRFIWVDLLKDFF